MKVDSQLKEDLKNYLEKKIKEKSKKVTLVTAYPLMQIDIEVLHRNIPGLKNVQIENFVDKKILAGFVLKFGSQIIDLSLKSQLESLNKFIYENN